MTEQEWLACPTPDLMLSWLRAKKKNRTKVGRRKLRLFGCAACRRVWRLLTARRGRKLLELIERYADGLLTPQELLEASPKKIGRTDHQKAVHLADLAAYFATAPNVMMATAAAASAAADAIEIEAWHLTKDNHAIEAMETAEQTEQANLLRDIFGNPFRPVTLDPAWQTATVVSLAQAIYNERAFERMPILGDALEEAGCTNAAVLKHCRQPGEHVRGCWVVDLVRKE